MLPIVEAKLKIPATYPNYLYRPAVSSKVKQLYRVPLTLVHSGAGYGKTSLLSHILQDEKRQCSWYTAQEQDDDIQPFLNYLMASLERVFPGIDEDFKTKRVLNHYPKPSDLQDWVTAFIEAVAPIDEDFVIVIDDYHAIDHSFSINFFLEKVISLLPESIHIVICSRQKPRWSNLVKLRSSGRLVEVTSADLQFQLDEIAYFYEDTYHLQVSQESLEAIVRLTEGWAIAVQLIGSYLADSQEVAVSLPEIPTEELFHFLAAEVVGKRTKEEQQMLYHLSLMESFDQNVIEHFYGEEGLRLLEELLRAHMFMQQIGTRHYRFHALFHQFLQTNFRTQMPESWLQQHQQLAEYHAHNQSIVQAMNHYRIVNDPDQLALKLLEYGTLLIQRGQFDFVQDVLDQVPSVLKERHIELFYLDGEVHRYKAYYEKAKSAYLACAEHAKENLKKELEAKSYIGVAAVYIDTIQPLFAEPYLNQALELAQHVDHLSQEMLMEWRCLRIENLVNLGQAEEAKLFMEQYGLTLEDLPAHNTDVRLHLRRGRLVEAKELVLQKRMHATSLPDMFREGTVLASFICAMMGESDDAMRLAEKAVLQGREEKSIYSEAVGYVRKGHAHLIAPVRELDEAFTAYKKAIDLLTTYNLNRAKAEPLMGMATVYRMQGLTEQANQAFDNALRETDKVQDSWLSAYLLVGKGLGELQDRDYIGANRTYQEALQSFARCGDVFGEFVTRFYLLFSEWRSSRSIDSDELHEVVQLMLTYNFDFFFTQNSLFGLQDPASSLPFWHDASQLLETEVRVEVQKKSGLVESVRPAAYRLDISLFGACSVSLGRQNVQERDWHRDKAKELLALLVLNRNRFLSKQEIYEELWPSTEFENAERDFKVTYNALLKVIEPEREARQESFFIERKGQLYRIRPSARILVDTELWKKELDKINLLGPPEMQLRHLKKAVSLYQGDIMSDRQVESKWIRREQENYRTAYLEALERIAQLYTRLQDFNKVIYWAEKILGQDETWEEAYRLLMYAYYQKKNRRRALELYATCERILHDELGVRPMETTENMHDLIRL